MRALGVFIILGSILLIGSGAAIAQAPDLKQTDILICEREGETPCTVNSPCHGRFTYCATVEQCENAHYTAKAERECLKQGVLRQVCCRRPPGKYQRNSIDQGGSSRITE
jgi:hypothetical protein